MRVKTSITLPQELLRRMDRADANRSAFIERAVGAHLDRLEKAKRDSSVHCDELVSLPKALLTHYVGRLGASKAGELNRALTTALDLDEAAA